MSLVIIGSIAFDDIETSTESMKRVVGGSATYISLAASFFVDKPQIVGVVGNDFLEEQLQVFKKRNVDIEGLQIIPTEKTFYWKGKYHTDFNTRDTLDLQLNVFSSFNPVIPKNYMPVEYLCLGNIDPVLQLDVLKKTNPKFVIGDTMNYWIDSKFDDVVKLISHLNCLIINDGEARQLTKTQNLIEAGKRIQKIGPKIVVIKKGEHGAVLFYESKIFIAPAVPLLTIKDPTGAGDCFAGGFFGYLIKTNDFSFANAKKAVLYGTVTASFCVEEFGTQKFFKINQSDMEKRYALLTEVLDIN